MLSSNSDKPSTIEIIYNRIKKTIINIITPPPAGNETSPLKEPLLTSKKSDSIDLLKDYR